MNGQSITPCSDGDRLTPSAWVEHFLSGARPGGHVLDIACGKGRHTRLALQMGFEVTAVDRDLSGIADIEGVANLHLVQMDLEAAPASGSACLDGLIQTAEKSAFDAVIVTNYLWRPLLPDIVAAVAPAGLLIYETFAIGNERYGRPKNPDYLLRPGELIDAVKDHLTPIAYQHATLTNPERVVARIVAVAPDHKWLTNPPPP